MQRGDCMLDSFTRRWRRVSRGDDPDDPAHCRSGYPCARKECSRWSRREQLANDLS